MKVKELIALLQAQNPEATVFVNRAGDCRFLQPEDVVSGDNRAIEPVDEFDEADLDKDGFWPGPTVIIDTWS